MGRARAPNPSSTAMTPCCLTAKKQRKIMMEFCRKCAALNAAALELATTGASEKIQRARGFRCGPGSYLSMGVSAHSH